MTPSLVEQIWALPGLRQLRERRALKHYLSPAGYGLHWGRFASFDEARRWLPPSPAFDHHDFADEYAEVRTQRVYAFDYPVMLWLGRALAEGARSIWDIGGSIGVHYYAYRKYLDYPDGLQWRVCEVPASVERGRRMAAEQGTTALSFETSLQSPLSHADVWMAAGAIEFIEEPLDELLRLSGAAPRHILLNKLPIHDGDAFVSTQNIGGGSFAAHHVFNRAAYCAAIERRGYMLVDAWKVHERSFLVPGKPRESFPVYGGLYFRKA